MAGVKRFTITRSDACMYKISHAVKWEEVVVSVLNMELAFFLFLKNPPFFML